MFIFYWSLHYFSFMCSFTFENERTKLISQRERLKITTAFWNSEALHIVRTVWNTSDKCDKLARFQMVFVTNHRHAQYHKHLMEYLLDKLPFCCFYFSQECKCNEVKGAALRGIQTCFAQCNKGHTCEETQVSANS